MNTDGIYGLLAPGDHPALVELVRSCDTLEGVLLEIGSLQGLSTLIILSASKDKPIHSFDLCHVPQFDSNIAAFGMTSRTRKFSGDFKSNKIQVPVAFAFVDHDHSYESSKEAYEWLWPLVVRGGVLAFHDCGHPDYPGGTKFIREVGMIENEFPGSAIAYLRKT